MANFGVDQSQQRGVGAQETREVTTHSHMSCLVGADARQQTS